MERDPKFALAYTGLADAYALLNWYVEPPPAGAFARAKQAALRAVELDQNLAESYSSLAFIEFYYDRDWSGAERDFRRAISINPNYAPVRHWYAMTLSAQGRHAEALIEVERALTLDPRSAIIMTAIANVQYTRGATTKQLKDVFKLWKWIRDLQRRKPYCVGRMRRKECTTGRTIFTSRSKPSPEIRRRRAPSLRTG
ncbi:MAG: tetratricopeptide repeat protein [Pyrinomonadaceae bacterium]